MFRRFATWHDAHAHAQATANRTGIAVAIRRVKEYGKDGYNVSFATKNEGGEIVRPERRGNRRRRNPRQRDEGSSLPTILAIISIGLFFLGRHEASGGSNVATMTQAQLATYQSLTTGALLVGILTNGTAVLSDGSAIAPDGTFFDPVQGLV